MKTIGIVGSRRRDRKSDYRKVLAKFEEIFEDGDRIVSGGCKLGGDRFAKEIAKQRGIEYVEHPAEWSRFGKGAGFVRNGRIAEDADVLIACVAVDRTGGTEDTIRKFLKKKSEDGLHLV